MTERIIDKKFPTTVTYLKKHCIQAYVKMSGILHLHFHRQNKILFAM